MNIGAIIQARTSSARLPGKVLKELPFGSGITVLEQVIRRLKRSKKLSSLIVATTLEKDDLQIVAVAKKEKVQYFRGDKEDVLSRYYLAAKKNKIDIIARITSDCPCIDPKVVDAVIEKHLLAGAHYTSNNLKRTYPRGLDVEVFNFDALKKAHESAGKNYEREHVTPYIYHRPSLFTIKQVVSPPELYAPDVRITLDTEEDYALLCVVFDCLYKRNKYFKASDIVALFKKKPWLRLVNKNVVQKKIFRDLNKDIDVRLGKAIDIFSLKSDVVNNFSSHVLHIKTTRHSLFNSKKLEKIYDCPVCDSSSKNSTFLVNIYGGSYHQCLKCKHCFLIKRPRKAILERFYSENTPYASTYANANTIETRVRQVVSPKANWTVEQFKRLYGRRPHGVVDVGAGAGHFVYACKKLGIQSYGVELSSSCIDFSKKHFGIKLNAVDFTKNWKMFKNIDVVTFWGVIEHVPNPVSLLKAAHKLLIKKDGMVIVEVPRWDSVSSIVQRLFSGMVTRHLEPLGHINVFTDSSLLHAFKISGFIPVAAWYFGMDAYELVVQLAHLSKDKRAVGMLKKHVNSIQEHVDKSRLSDTIVLAGKPVI